jgi:putative transposase
MKELGIYSAIAVKNTSKPGKGKNHKKYPYLLRNMVIQYVNQVWATDITYIALPHGFVYLCAVIDLYSRKILAWKLSNTMDVNFCIECLEKAIEHYGVPSIFNSDQGTQFTSNEFLAILIREHVRISMDSVGQAMDNILVERTWRSLKYEHIFLHDYSTMTELKAGLDWFINYFNTTRPHQSLGYYAPNDIYYNSFAGAEKKEEKLVNYS